MDGWSPAYRMRRTGAGEKSGLIKNDPHRRQAAVTPARRATVQAAEAAVAVRQMQAAQAGVAVRLVAAAPAHRTRRHRRTASKADQRNKQVR